MTDTRDPRMHDGTWTGKRPAYLPPAQRTPLAEAHAAADRELQVLQDSAARGQTGSWLSRPPQEVAARVGGLVQMACREEHPSADTWARIIAYGLAGWCSAARVEELDITAGAD